MEICSSEWNPHIEVLLVEGRHQLVTKDAIYSFDDKYENFYESFRRLDWSKVKGKEVLVLGLGLGSVIKMLELNFQKKLNYTAIEIDHEICRLAQKYTLDYLSSWIETIPTDAEYFIETCQQKFDLILMDIFESAIIPQKFQNKLYLSKLKSCLTEDGVLLYNRMNLTESDKIENKNFITTFKQVFPNSGSIKIKDNTMMINNSHYLKSL